MNWCNPQWVNHLSGLTARVYQNLAFDGFGIDQLGQQRGYYANLKSKKANGQKAY